MIVEHDAAAAVHLEVDEARRDQAAAEVDRLHAGRQRTARDDGLDAFAIDHQRRVVVPRQPVEDARAGECEAPVHSVSVTLRRLGGASGSRPRWRAKASTKA